MWVYANGRFEENGGKGWTEVRKDGTTTAYNEVASTAEYVELHDPVQDVRVRLFAFQGRIKAKDSPTFKPGAVGRWQKPAAPKP